MSNYSPIKTMAVLAIFSLAGCTEGPQTPEATGYEAQAAAPGALDKFEAYTQRFPETTVITQSHATGHVGDFFFTHWKDGGSASLTLSPEGEFSVSWEGGGYNYVGGPGWHYGDEDRMIGYRFDEDSGASYITLYGWGYDETMPTSDPAHLVEYYVLQRWTYDPSQNAEYGTTFVSNGIEYSTYRSVRDDKPSINGPSTFYQYWSKPAEQRPLGEDHEIIFADHVKAWAETGWIIPDMNNLNASDDPTYLVMAVEVFNPADDGTASGRVWDAAAQ
ncbi:glycoside hydrolase family 11 protein [Marinimicrobium alkaliphilum]|uniref:glycoside hydrolase family 11 protein n=1 Tax=Marinimicrobium alkaliphilum TaxID=2202654 RepID=UPI0018E0B35A|nr:glycoside hydrolase family 11 protein [Marinimicrobium alkaliphilum]